MNDMDAGLMQDFLTESGELIEQLDQDLVTLESLEGEAQSETCNACFRALHTIKGAAGFLGLDPVIEFAHAAEDALNKLRKGEVPVTPPVMDLLLQSADVVRAQIEQLGQGSDPDRADPALIAQLNAIGNDAPDDSDADASESDDKTADENLPGTKIDLGPQKMDLIEFMAADLKDYVGQLDEAINGIANDATREESADSLGEIADNLVKTADFFELDDLTRLTTLLLDIAPKLHDAKHDLLDDIVVRVRACQSLIDDQAGALENERALSWELDTFTQRLSSLADGNAVDAAGHNNEVASVLQLDGVTSPDTPGSPDTPATDAGPIAKIQPTPDTPAKTQAPNDTKADADATQKTPEKEEKRDGDDRRQTDRRQNAAAAPEQTIRVEVGRLEELLNLVGQLVLSKNRINSISRDSCDLPGADPEYAERVAEAASDLDRITSELQVGVMRTRMQPLAKLFDRYPRVVRDIARATSKQINLDVQGKETEVDKTVLEALADPLIHILRNSADHGVEMPEDRKAAGKTEQGTIRLTAEHQGSHVRVAIADDGKGLNREVLAAKAIERGLTTADACEKLSDSEVFRFIFEAGFSTAKQVSNLSGRGVGMDVVRTNIAKLNGTINIYSTFGQGTTIEILIPLTVAIMPAMVIESNDEQYAIPLQTITEIVRPEDCAVSSVQGKRVLRIRDSVLPLIDLRDQLRQPPADPDQRFAVVVKIGENFAGLIVDSLIGQQEIVIKPLDDSYTQGGPFTGATIREDGRVCLILDVVEVLKDHPPQLAKAA